MTARLRTSLLPLALALFCGCPRPRSVEHILLVTLDTTRADRLGCYGHAGAETPSLDGLAKEATLFEQAEATVPVTLPSHTTMLTGLQPYRTGIRYNMIRVLPASATTLAERLAGSGYRTGAIVSAAVLAARFGLNQGFATYQDDLPKGSGGELPERTAAEAVDRAIRWWDEAGEGKRFLWVHLFSPHYPYVPPFPYSTRFAQRPYEGEIAYMDRELGRLFAHLQQKGDWKRTLVIVCGDHGEGLYDHGERWHAQQVYESTLHVPLLIKPPGRASGRRVSEPVGLVDLTPTVLDYVGTSVQGLDGVSLRRAVETGTAPRRSLYFESTTAAINFGWSPLHGVRRGPMKYFQGARPELYDLASDPRELNNLAGKESEAQSALGRDLAVHLEAADADARTAEGEQALDPETMAQLTSLGYIGGLAEATSVRGRGIHPPDMPDLEQEVLRAQGAYAAGRLDEAAEALDYILRRDPTNQFALHFRARTFASQGAMPQAVQVAEVLAKLAPESASATDLLGEMLTGAGKAKEAAEVYRQALERGQKEPVLRFHRVVALVEAADLAEAGAEQRRLEGERPRDYATAMAAALVEAASGRTADALRSLGRAADLGMTRLDPVEESRFFRQVRKDPAYATLQERLAKARKS